MSLSVAGNFLVRRCDGQNSAPLGQTATTALQAYSLIVGTMFTVIAVAGAIMGKAMIWESTVFGITGVMMIAGGATGYLGLTALAMAIFLGSALMQACPDVTYTAVKIK